MQDGVSVIHIIYTVLFILALVFPLYKMGVRELERRSSPEYFREYGVIVKTINALDEMYDVIGRYMGVNIYREVVFKGMRYTYDFVAPPSYKRRISENQLFLEPGLVYVVRR